MSEKRINAIAKVLNWATNSRNSHDPWVAERTKQFVERTGLKPAQCLGLMSDINSHHIDMVEFIKTVDEIVDEPYRSENHPSPLD